MLSGASAGLIIYYTQFYNTHHIYTMSCYNGTFTIGKTERGASGRSEGARLAPALLTLANGLGQRYVIICIVTNYYD